MKPNKKPWIAVAVMIALLLAVPFILKSNQAKQLEEVPLSTVISASQSGQVSMITQQGSELEVTLKGDSEPSLISRAESGVKLESYGIDGAIIEHRIEKQGSSISTKAIIAGLLPAILVVFYIVMFVHNLRRQGSDKILWAAVLLFGGIIIGSGIYYFAVYRKSRF